MKKISKILVIIQRSNGDVLLSVPLINSLQRKYKPDSIDLLVNEDTFSTAKLLPHISLIHTFSYKKKKADPWKQELSIIKNIYRNYDLSINLTASDRSVIYSILASKRSISAIEEIKYKAWWKKILLTDYYFFDTDKHIVFNNLEASRILKIFCSPDLKLQAISDEVLNKTRKMLNEKNIKKFIIFHPSAQYYFKIYPKHLRNILLKLLSDLGISIVITGTKNRIDTQINNELPKLPNLFNFIGKTNLEEYLAISFLSSGYIGMDTLNMHIAAIQKKRIFAIFGPSNLKMWAPWSKELKGFNIQNRQIQKYGKVTIFQSALPCVACGNAGCDNSDRSECLHTINPNDIFNEVKKWQDDENF